MIKKLWGWVGDKPKRPVLLRRPTSAELNEAEANYQAFKARTLTAYFEKRNLTYQGDESIALLVEDDKETE